MEVHAHSHTARKKWTHYFWEFLMLFLAVFCGFLAEYKLEQTIEHKREKEYMRSLADDLASDTVSINSWFIDSKNKLKNIDSSLILLTTYNSVSAIAENLYRFRNSLGIGLMEFNDRTSIQLKNSGSMRMVRKKNVADSILTYWQKISGINQRQDRFEHYRANARYLSFRIFNTAPGYVNRFRLTQDRVLHPKLINSSQEILAEYASHLSILGNLMREEFRNDFLEQKKRAATLITLIKKEYHLK